MTTTPKQCQQVLMYLFDMAEDQYTRITLRIPKKLQADLMRQAFITSKSNNAEIIGRLQSTFEPAPTPKLPASVQAAVDREVERNGGTAEEALARLVEVGEQHTRNVVNLRTHHGITLDEFSAMVQAVAKQLPPETIVITSQG